MAGLVRIGDVMVDVGDLDATQARALVAARDRELARSPAVQSVAATRPVLLVRVAATRLAVPLDAVATVVATPPTNRVPGAPAHHLGLFVHAGATVNLLAIEAALALEPGSRATALLLAGDAPRIALAVDEALGIGQAAADVTDGRAPTARAIVEPEGEVALVTVARLLAALGLGAEGEFDR